MSHSDVAIIRGESDLFDRVEPLWLELRQHHAGIAPIWQAELLAATFQRRRNGLQSKATGGLLVLLATSAGRDVGYCVCTVDEQQRGEVDSIYICDDHRGLGIGRALLREAMQWLTGRQPTSIVVEVLAENESAMRLYREFGFHPRTVWLRHVPEAAAEPSAAADRAGE